VITTTPHDGSHNKEMGIFSFAMVMIEARCEWPTVAAAGKHPPRPSHQTSTDESWALMECCWSYDRDFCPEASASRFFAVRESSFLLEDRAFVDLLARLQQPFQPGNG